MHQYHVSSHCYILKKLHELGDHGGDPVLDLMELAIEHVGRCGHNLVLSVHCYLAHSLLLHVGSKTLGSLECSLYIDSHDIIPA